MQTAASMLLNSYHLTRILFVSIVKTQRVSYGAIQTVLVITQKTLKRPKQKKINVSTKEIKDRRTATTGQRLSRKAT